MTRMGCVIFERVNIHDVAMALAYHHEFKVSQSSL